MPHFEKKNEKEDKLRMPSLSQLGEERKIISLTSLDRNKYIKANTKTDRHTDMESSASLL